MRLFVLLNTGLADASRLADPPVRGDAVCYIRLAQDVDGCATQRLKDSGIKVVFGDSLFDEADSRALDAVGTRFLQGWFRDGGEDFSSLGDISLGVAYSMEIARQTNPRVILRFGEILRRILALYPAATALITDVRDGDGIFEVEPDYLPLHRTLAEIAARHGVGFSGVAPVDPIPPALRRVRHSNWGKTIKSLAGGLRPRWIAARWRLARNARARPGRPTLYMILGRGQEPMARRLAASGRLRVVTSRSDISGADAARGDHIFAMPNWADAMRVRALLRRLAVLARPRGSDGRYVVQGFDYGPLLYGAVRAVIVSQVWPFLVVVAQSRRLWRCLGYDALFVAGAGAEFMGNLVALDRQSCRRVYLMPHGLDLQRFAYPMPASDQPHVTYLAYGADHAGFYVSDGGPGLPVRSVLIGNPLTAAMNEARRRRRPIHGKRLLILSFGHLEFWNADRIYAGDLYYAGLFTVARSLIAEGWRIGLRAHPSHPRALEERLAAAFGIEGAIDWDEYPSFEESLTHYDVAVCSASTTCYQALYAGWPTILFEPDYRGTGDAGLEHDPMLTGLATAGDIRRPVTTDPATLLRLVRLSLDPDSMVSTFPRRFAGELAPRFIGPDAGAADRVAAAFIEHDILSASADRAGTNHAATAA